jgi:translocator protein
MFHWLKNLFHKEETSKKEKIISAIIFFLYIFAIGFANGGMDTKSQAFYNSLIKPGLTPPGWVFPIVWTILFALIGLTGYYIWNYYKNDRYRKIFSALYVVNGIFIYLWSYVFFRMQDITSALYVIVAMIILIEIMILVAFKTNHKAAYLLMPYFLWVLFATYLNTAIIGLNG